MATPQYSPQFANHPVSGNVAIEPDLFNDETEKQIIPLNPRQGPSGGVDGVYGTSDRWDVPRRGIYSMLSLSFEGSAVVSGVGGGTMAIKKAFTRGGLLKNVMVRANGVPLHNVEGADLKALEQITYNHATMTTEQQTVAAANGTYAFRQTWELPLAADQHSLTGCLFSESEQNYFDVVTQYATKAECFDLAGGANCVITGTMKVLLTTFEVVRAKVGPNGETMTVLPDVTAVYQCQSIDPTVTANGRQAFSLPRVDGNMLRVYGRFINGNAAGQDSVDPSTITTHEWSYGLNIKPRIYTPGYWLTDRNAKDYNGVVAPDYFVHDFVEENAIRDAVAPSGISEPVVAVDFGVTTINANARLHLMMETLARGSNFEAQLYQ